MTSVQGKDPKSGALTRATGIEFSPDVSSPGIPVEFTKLENLFVRRTEEALIDGIQLERWMRDPNRRIDEFELPSVPTDQLKNHAWGYFADVTISDRTLPALGARQEVEFGSITGNDAEEQLKNYVFGTFLNDATWVYGNGDTGGFTLEQLVYCTPNGCHGRYAEDHKKQARDWRELGTKYRWSLFTIFLHDFVFRLGRFKAPFVPRGAVTVVQSPDFVHIVERPKPGIKLEVAIGFPFIDHAPIPTFFGFGPGKFAWAVQTFSFLLRDDNTVRCDMDFVAGPRPKKVFDFGKFPDPIYGTADSLKALTFGLFPAQKVRDFWDAKMALRHCRVHQALLEGTARIFAASQQRRNAA